MMKEPGGISVNMQIQISREEFIKREIAIWSEDYIFDLLDRGYDVKLTTEGYKWFAPVYEQIDNYKIAVGAQD